jgi:hypothetical protein
MIAIDMRLARLFAVGLLGLLVAVACGSTPSTSMPPTSMPSTSMPPTSTPSTSVPSTPATSAPRPNSLTTVGKMGWIIGWPTLSDLLAHDTAGVVRPELDHPTTYLIVGPRMSVPSGWSVTLTETFTDADALVRAVETGALWPGVRAVLLDIENWQFSPLAQQQDPGTAYTRAASAAHAHGLKLVATPAMNLAAVMGRLPGESVSAAYLRLRVAALAGAHADVFQLQSQSLEFDPANFAATLQAVGAQVRAVNPSIVFFGGVSTNVSGRLTTAAQMLAAVQAAGPTVSGYWLNDPAGGAYCPKCSGPYPTVAVALLAALPKS